MLKIRQMYKHYASHTDRLTVVDNINLDVERGSFVTLLGPSGCGKTTTLRMIAGLETPSSGTIEIDGEMVYSDKGKLNVPVNRRPIAMVFQSYAIWPHMNVFQNVAFPLQGAKFKLSTAEIRERTEEALLTVGLQNHATRASGALSGGQQQRVALARALVSRPKLLLLDEPLSNLDVRLRDEMRDKIKELHESTKLTTIFVTHDQNEAMALSSHMVIMNSGKIVEMGSPQKVFERPTSRFAANFVGKYNIFEGTIAEIDDHGKCTIDTENGKIVAQLANGLEPISLGSRVLAFIRPNSIKVGRPENQTDGMQGIVQSAIYQGSFWELKVTLNDGNTGLVHLDLANARDLDLTNLSRVHLSPDAKEVVVVADETYGP